MVKNLSVFFPVFNEEGNIATTVNKAVVVLDKLKIDYEIIVVNDGSTDKTAQVVEKLTGQNSKIKLISHPQNLGYGEALKSGFYNARYDVVVYTDGDGQFDFSEVTKFLEKIKDNDLVIGYRIKRRDPLFRILFKKGWKLSLLLSFGMTLKDVDCGFKMIKKSVLAKIPHLESTRGAMINAELAISAKKYGFKVGQVGVNHYPRLTGVPTGAGLRVIFRSYIDLLRLWWKLKDQKILFLGLAVVVFLAAFLRFYRLSEYMTFLGDEGRDAIIIKKMLVNHDLPFIGPPTSVGNIYLGPLYYYMIAIPMAIFWLNPVAAAGVDATIGVLTVLLIYYLGKIWFGRYSGLISAYLYAISPVTIIYSRSSWNPNPAPFFALLGIFGLYKIHKSGNFLWLILVGFALAAGLQMHYLAVILIPIAFILWIYEVWLRKKQKMLIKNLLPGTILGVLTFLLVMSPLLLFDLKHDFLNYKAITALLTQGTSVQVNIFSNISRILSLYFYNLIDRYMAAENFFLAMLVSILLLVAIIFRLRSWPILALTVWLIIGLLGLSFYQQSVYDHYLGFLNPAPFILFGSLFILLKNKLWKMGIIVLVFVLTLVNLGKNPLFFPPNNQLKRTQEVTKFVIRQSEGGDFNFALLSKNNYDSAYQFYLDLYGHKPSQVPFEITDQLFVVCETEVCDPINNPKYEIAGFGWAKIVDKQDFYGVKVFKLSHNPSGKPQ